MEKSPRNRTLELSLEDGAVYLERCLRPGGELTVSTLTNRVVVGDTFSLLPSFPRQFADLLIVDPPYNIDKNFGGNSFSRQSREDYRTYTVSWLEAVLPVLKPDASVYVCCDWQSSLIIGAVLQEYLHVRNRITWQREKGRGAAANWKNGMEDIWFATCSEQYTFHLDDVKIRRRVLAPYRSNGTPKDWEETPDGNFRNTCPSNFWDDISVPYWSMPENTPHPTQKPEKLLAKLILASSEPDAMVFDPFLGSGSTAVAAKKLGRRYCGIEQNELYCVWAEKRLRLADTDRSIQGYENGVFWERNAKLRRSGKKAAVDK